MIENKDKAEKNPAESFAILTPEEGKVNDSPKEQGDKAETVPLKKFSSAEELSKAYTALEAEFTRRSQKIRELEKLLNEKDLTKKPEESALAEGHAKKPEEKDKWENKVKQLIERYPIAKDLAENIEDFLKQNENLIKLDDCLEIALINVLSNGYVSKGEQEKKEIALKEELLLNGKFKHQVIADYINSLQNSAPKVMPKGGEIPLVAPQKPLSIKEAGAYAEKLFKL